MSVKGFFLSRVYLKRHQPRLLLSCCYIVAERMSERAEDDVRGEQRRAARQQLKQQQQQQIQRGEASTAMATVAERRSLPSPEIMLGQPWSNWVDAAKLHCNDGKSRSFYFLPLYPRRGKGKPGKARQLPVPTCFLLADCMQFFEEYEQAILGVTERASEQVQLLMSACLCVCVYVCVLVRLIFRC